MGAIVDRTLGAIAGYGLPVASPTLPREPLDEPTWVSLLERAVDARITGHLVRAIEAGALPATDSQYAAAAERHERALGLDLLLERLLLESVTMLDDRRIAVRVLKGAALAHTIYPDPGLRSFVDVDLLVPARQYDAAVEALQLRGARRRYREPRSGFDRRFGKGVCLVTPDGYEIDLHRTFVAGAFGLTIDTDELFVRSTSFTLGGRRLGGLDPEDRFIHACFHAALGDVPPRLVPLRDVAQILLHSTVDTDRVRERCADWRCGIVVQRAIRLAWQRLGLDEDREITRWARHYEPGRFEQRALRAYLGDNRSYARQVATGLAAVPGLGAKAAYTRALLLPDRPYVREHDGGYARRLVRAGRLLLDRGGGQRTHRTGATTDPSSRPSRRSHQSRSSAALESLDGVESPTFRCLGFDWSIQADAAFVDHVTSLYAACRIPEPPRHRFELRRASPGSTRVTLLRNGQAMLSDACPELAIAHLVWEVNRGVVEEPGNRLLFHAAAAERGGRVVLIPGTQGAGKSTLVAALVQAGLRYLTDETAAVDAASTTIEPYPKPIALDHRSASLLPRLSSDLVPAPGHAADPWLVAPLSIRPDAVAPAGGVAVLVVLPVRRPGHPPTATPIARAEAAIALAEHSFNFRTRGRGALELIARVLRSCDCYRLELDDLVAGCDLVLDLLDPVAESVR